MRRGAVARSSLRNSLALPAAHARYLNYISLTGTIPSELGALTALVELCVAQLRIAPPHRGLLVQPSPPRPCEVIGALSQQPLASARSVTHSATLSPTLHGVLAVRRHLSHNQLNGTIPSELGALSALTTLRAEANQLNGAIPSELSALTALIHLCVARRRLVDHPRCVMGAISKPLPSRASLWHSPAVGFCPTIN